MRGYYTFVKKELLEQLRTFKWLIVLAVFFAFGMMSPLAAKFMPEMLKTMDLEGMTIVLPEPVMTDSYGQFFKNMTQMGIVVLLLVFGGTLSGELTKGTLVNILAKGLPRHTIILSKYSASVVLWTLGYALSFITTYGYTVYLFEEGVTQNLMFSLFCLWLFGCFLLALILLSSTIADGGFGGLILSAVGLALMLLLNIFPWAHKYNPITLASDNMDLILGNQTVSGLSLTVWITIILTVISLLGAVLLFQRKRIS